MREWVKADSARVASEDLAELRNQIDEVREGMKSRGGLEVVR